MKQPIQTDKAPPSGGTYSQAIKAGNTVYLAGQIPINPLTKELVDGDLTDQFAQCFENLKAVAEAAGGNINSIVRVCVYLTNENQFPTLNKVMPKYFNEPYPARTTIIVAALPKNADIEIDAIMVV